jgi:hypothetical protein
VCQHEIVLGRQAGELLLGHVEVAQSHVGLQRPGQRGDERGEDRQARAVEGGHRHGPRRTVLEARHGLLGPLQRHLYVDSRRGEGAAGVGQRRPASVLERQRDGGAPLQGAELLRDRGRRDEHGGGDGRDAAALAELPQCAQLSYFH